MKYLIVSVAALFVTASAFGEPVTAVPATNQTAAADPTPVKLSPYLQLLELQTEVAERNYSTAQNTDTLSEYIDAAQAFLTAGCFDSLRSTLHYGGFPNDTYCRGLIKKVLAIDANNPIALCSQNGIDSRECRETSAQIVNGSFEVDSGSWHLDDQTKSGTLPPIDLKTALDQKSQHKQISDQRFELGQLAGSLRSHSTDLALRDKYQTLLEKTLTAACVDIKYLVRPLSDQKSSASIFGRQNHDGGASEAVPSILKIPARKTSADDQADPFSKLLNTMNSGAPTPMPTAMPLIFSGPNNLHYRLLPAGCANVLKSVPNFVSFLPVVVCNRDGPVSPTCITARRNSVRPPAKKSANQNTGDAFSNF